MSRGWIYKSGDWNVICDVCSLKTKASKTKQRWDGFIVCKDCWEPRHSMDFIRARSDKIQVPFIRPQPTDTFVTITYRDTDNTDIPQGTFEFYYIDVGYIDDNYFETGSS